MTKDPVRNPGNTAALVTIRRQEVAMMSITMVAADVLENTVALACRAPSYHNSQPWRWTADRDG